MTGRSLPSEPCRRWSGPIVLIGCLLATGPAQSATDVSAVCETAAADAALRTGVPVTVLQAISLTETGRKDQSGFRPWPWTVNMEGKGYWFDTQDDARAFVYREYKRGARSFDVGCFQINYKWHGEAFASIEQMFDPAANADYAARFLADLYRETGSWSDAAGAYHSRNPAFADSYRARFDRIRARVAGNAGLPPASSGPDAYGSDPAASLPLAGRSGSIPEIPDIVLVANGGTDPGPNPDLNPGAGDAFGGGQTGTPRVNTFPLLLSGASGGMGSLVPITELAAAPLFGDPADTGVTE